MAVEYMTFQEVLEELQIDEEELKRLVSNAELRGFRAGSSMKFKRDDVMNLKQGRETEPTIILTDSDQEMGIAESSDELILEDSTSDTVIHIGDIMGARSGSQQEIIFDTTEEYTVSPHDSDISSGLSAGLSAGLSGSAPLSASGSAGLSGSALSGSALSGVSEYSGLSGLSGFESGDSMDPEAVIPTVEVPSVSEDMGLVETDSDAALVEVGSDESMETEAFELMDESGESDTVGSGAIGAVKGSRRASRRNVSASTRMRALEIEQKSSHAAWTIGILISVILLCVHFGILYSDLRGTTPQWVDELTNPMRNMVDSLYVTFNG